MTTTNGAVGDLVEGLVESANDHGIKVAGEWRNVSKFKTVDLPDRGARVRLELDGKGFIKSLTVLDGAPSSTAGNSSQAETSLRQRTITRLAVLKAASNFLGLMGQSHEEVRSDHVLLLADKWLAWVEQTDDREEDEQF
jgi:hypothetical protein